MRNSKYFLVSLAVLIFITVSIVFLSIWGYRAFFAENNSLIIKDTVYATPVKNSEGQTVGKDSFQTVVNEPVNVDTGALQQKLLQLAQLQAEIKALLENQKTSDSSGTSGKIKKLEDDIKNLELKNKSMVAQNRRLEKTVTKLAKTGNAVSEPKGNESSPTSGNPEESPVKVSNVNLFALAGDMSVTLDASGANFLRGSFYVKASGVSSGELMVIVIDPDGKVLINGPWESGYFETSDGRKLYSAKLHFEKPEQRINFSLSTNNLKQGTYVLQVYYKGGMIATLKKTFS